MMRRIVLSILMVASFVGSIVGRQFKAQSIEINKVIDERDCGMAIAGIIAAHINNIIGISLPINIKSELHYVIRV